MDWGNTPRELTMLRLDRWMPLVPFTIWIYLSDYLHLIGAYWICKGSSNLTRMVYSLVTLEFVGVAIHVAYPTAYPRFLFPLPVGISGLTLWLWNFTRAVDFPTNCLPSLHAGNVTLAWLAVKREYKWLGRFWLLWTILILISTMTTKQHYFVDLIAGVSLAFCLDFGFRRVGQPDSIKI